MRLLIDTNRYDDLNKGVPSVVYQIADAEEVWLSLFVLAELRFGFLNGTKRDLNETLLKRFLDKPHVNVLQPTIDTADFYAAVLLDLRRNGTPIPVNDIWIAAQAKENDLTMYTRDKHFLVVPDLKYIPWSAE